MLIVNLQTRRNGLESLESAGSFLAKVAGCLACRDMTQWSEDVERLDE